MNINLFENNQQPTQKVATNIVTSNGEIMNMEQANADYVRKNSEIISRKGLLDAGRSGGAPQALELGLSQVRSEYISFCREHATLYREQIGTAVKSLHSLQQRLVAEVDALRHQREQQAECLSNLRGELSRLCKRHYRVVEFMKLLLALVVVFAVGSWLCYVYGNFFFDLTCKPQELKQLGLFSVEGMQQGVTFCVVPLALAVFISMTPRRYLLLKVVLAMAFTAMDVIFSYQVETRLVTLEQAMGVNAQFDTLHFLMITFWAFIPAVCLTSSLSWAKDMFYLDGVAEARADQEKLHQQIAETEKAISEQDAQIAKKQGEIDNVQRELSPKEKDNNSGVYWYSGNVVRLLSSLYFKGFMTFACSLENDTDTEKQTQLKVQLRTAYENFLKAA